MKKTSCSALILVASFSALLSCSKKTIVQQASGSSSNPNDSLYTLILQPGPSQGQECLVAYRESDNGLYANANHHLNPDVTAIAWTYFADNAGEGVNRTYLKFSELSSLFDNGVIVSAKLSLYGVTKGVAAPLGNSFFSGSPYESYGDNSCWLKRVLSDWNDTTITWNTKPKTTDQDKATVPYSTSQWNSDANDIDVTGMVKQMVSGKQNYGFCMMLKNEHSYRSILFGSSEWAEETKRPRLVVSYQTKRK